MLFFIGSGAGLMVIGNVASMAKASMGEAAFVAVAIMAVGNASGRIIAGVASDVIGRRLALVFFMTLQAINMFLAVYVVGAQGSAALMIVLSATFIGFNYGTNLALFPAYAKTWWGLKSFGTNYGCLMTAWGVGGFVMTRVSSMLVVNTGGYVASFTLHAGAPVKPDQHGVEGFALDITHLSRIIQNGAGGFADRVVALAPGRTAGQARHRQPTGLGAFFEQ